MELAVKSPDNSGAGLEQLYPECLNPSVKYHGSSHDGEIISIPHGADTAYLGHGYYRYIGKYPPQIVSLLLNDYQITGKILDPMAGGGTTLVEARLRGLDATACDINPVSRLVTECVANPEEPDAFERDAAMLLDDLSEVMGEDGLFSKKLTSHPPFAISYCRDYFSPEALSDLTAFSGVVARYSKYRRYYQMSLFAVLRRISRANIKKMNLEIDERRVEIPRLLPTYASHVRDVIKLNRAYYAWSKSANIDICGEAADATGLGAGTFDAVFLHPPYLTNTAFSEFTQLQLALIGINHKDIWKRELRCRGSFLHEANGLKKYMVGWKRIMEEAVRVLRPGGYLFTVIGDGQIDYVRIPLGAITTEFGRDIGLKVERRMVHMLNNHTGQTQSRKMTGQHLAVFQKSA